MTDTAGALAGLSIAITRPAPQGEALAERLRNCAAAATTIPLLAIAPLDSPAQRESVKTQLQNLGAIDIAIFVSRNAVEQLLQALADHHLRWPSHIATIAVGSATAQLLNEHGIAAISPARMDSEGMLALPALQSVQGKRCVIFRGQGGREKTAHTLRERGAMVDYCELYRRVLPPEAAEVWAQWLANGEPRQWVCINSVEILNNLLQIDSLAPTRANLSLVVPGERVTEQAVRAGFLRVYTALDATDNNIFQTITHWY